MFRRSVNVSLLALACILLAQSAMSAGKPYLGISLAAKIPPALASQLKLDGGAMIISVAEKSPAAKAGLKVHDIIIKVAGNSIKSPADLKKVLSSHPDKENLELTVRRRAATLEFSVKPGVAPPPRPQLESAPARPQKTKPADGARVYLGVRLAAIPPSLASHLKLSANEGVLVEKTLPGSPAYDANLQKHDVILQVAGKAVTSSRKNGNTGTIIFPEEFRDLQLRGIRGGITGGLRIESLESLFGNSRDGVTSNLHQLIAAKRPGEEVELSIVRAGEKKTVRVTLATDPATRRSPPGAFRRGNLGNSSVSSSVTVSDGDLTVTVRENNGRKTFSVRRGKEVIADNEPWESLDKMPADIQESVRRLKVRSSRGSGSGGGPIPPGEKKKPPREEKKKPI